MIRSGTCAWADHQHFYPKTMASQERLRYYARFFSIVEVDSTYYALPRRQVAQFWAKSVPADFSFHVKAHGSMTLHDRSRPVVADKDGVFKAFADVVEPLRAVGKLRCILFQFPPWVKKSQPFLDYIESCRMLFQDDMFAVEFRHRSWFMEQETKHTLAWLRDHHVVNVVCDEPQVGAGSIPFVAQVTDPRMAMIRMHGRNSETWAKPGLKSSQERFQYEYAREELLAIMPDVRQMAEKADEVHILMNNNYDNYAIRGASLWQQLLGQASILPEFSEQMGWFDESPS